MEKDNVDKQGADIDATENSLTTIESDLYTDARL
jgi:hypothetical protein